MRKIRPSVEKMLYLAVSEVRAVHREGLDLDYAVIDAGKKYSVQVSDVRIYALDAIRGLMEARIWREELTESERQTQIYRSYRKVFNIG